MMEQNIAQSQPHAYGIDLEAQENWNKERLKSAKVFAEGTLKHQQGLKEEELMTDETFQSAVDVVSMHLGEPQEGTPEEKSRYGLQLVNDLTIPTVTLDGKGMAGLFLKFKEADPEVKQALWYMIDSNNKKEETRDGAIRVAKSAGKDLSMYATMGTAASFNFFGKRAAKSLAMKKVEEFLVTTGVTGAYTATDEFLMQGLQDKGYDYGKIAEQAGLGAAMGGILAVGLPLAMKSAKWTGQQGLKYIDDIMQGNKELDNKVLAQAVQLGRQNIVENTKGLKVLKNSETGLDLEINGAKVRVTDNKDGTYTPDLSQLESGSGGGSAIYNELFSLGDKLQMKYKASKDLTPENKIRLPLALLKYKSKVSSSNFTVENVDKHVDNLISIISKFIPKNKSLLTLSRADLKKLSKEVSKKDKDETGAFISVDNLKMLQEYLIEKEGL